MHVTSMLYKVAMTNRYRNMYEHVPQLTNRNTAVIISLAVINARATFYDMQDTYSNENDALFA